MNDPACEGVDPERFYGGMDSRPDGPIAAWEWAALAVCAGCPVRAECLRWALEWSAYHQHGVVGGATAGQRRAWLAVDDSGCAA